MICTTALWIFFGLILTVTFFGQDNSGTPVNFGAPSLSRSGLGQGSRLQEGLVLPLTVPVGEISLVKFSGV
jgi:hypothetical protein